MEYSMTLAPESAINDIDLNKESNRGKEELGARCQASVLLKYSAASKAKKKLR